eukprot:CAMPEP_0173187670 /NCGR_PEP_ID=MMETSP1141-20130122/10836_1 /TAXON_ID=483371 /ORGANISM="non described non described, Strain CCMP2298" /LENGTH=126 /DNA_ID=CAMNT_0014111529 /DNA_START=159 /DNA_END=539 /DNA_ORIENTATION=+
MVFCWCTEALTGPSSMIFEYPNKGIEAEFSRPFWPAVRALCAVTGLSHIRHLACIAAEASAELILRSPTASVMVLTMRSTSVMSALAFNDSLNKPCVTAVRFSALTSPMTAFMASCTSSLGTKDAQ